MMLGSNKNSASILSEIPKNSIGAEIGVWKGDTSELFLKTIEPKKLHLVDPWSFEAFAANLSEERLKQEIIKYSKITKSTDPKSFVEYYDNVFTAVKSRFIDYRNVVIHKKTSTEWFNTFKAKLDWIYIDGDHSYDGCLNDLNNCLKVMKKKKGVIFGDDYGNKPDVKRAVDDFIASHGFKLTILGENQYKIELI